MTIVSGVLVCASAGVAAGVAARWLLGRLRRGTRVRAPVCEAGVGLLWAIVGGGWGGGLLPGRWVPVLLALGWFGVAAGVVDARHHRLPDALTLPALGFAPVALLPVGATAVERGVVAGLAGIAAYGVVHLLAPAAMGAGDVKLAGSLATVLGAASWTAPVVAAGLAAALTAVLAVGVLAATPRTGSGWSVRRAGVPPRPAPPGRRRRTGRRASGSAPPSRSDGVGDRPVSIAVPHGPSMLAAAWLVTGVAASGVGS